MTVSKKIVDLQLSEDEVKRYTPRTGIDVEWYNWNYHNNTVTAKFAGTDRQLFWQERITKDDIEDEIEHKFGRRTIERGSNNSSFPSKGKTLRSILLLDDIYLDQFPRGTKHSILNKIPLKTRNYVDSQKIHNLITDRLGTYNKKITSHQVGVIEHG